MSEFVSPTSLTYIFLDVSTYSKSDKGWMKDTWVDLAQKFGAEDKDPEAIIQKKVTHELLFEGVKVVDTKATNGLMAAFRDAGDAESFTAAVHQKFDNVDYRGDAPITEFKTTDLSFINSRDSSPGIH